MNICISRAHTWNQPSLKRARRDEILIGERQPYVVRRNLALDTSSTGISPSYSSCSSTGSCLDYLEMVCRRGLGSRILRFWIRDQRVADLSEFTFRFAEFSWCLLSMLLGEEEHESSDFDFNVFLFI